MEQTFEGKPLRVGDTLLATKDYGLREFVEGDILVVNNVFHDRIRVYVKNDPEKGVSVVWFAGSGGFPPLHEVLIRVDEERPQEPREVNRYQIGGNHYSTLKIQPLTYAMANKMDGPEMAVLKYITRHKSKGGQEDLEKARDMLSKMIENYKEWYLE